MLLKNILKSTIVDRKMNLGYKILDNPTSIFNLAQEKSITDNDDAFSSRNPRLY